MEFVLASSSPRRRDLLAQAGFRFRPLDPGQVEDEMNLDGQPAVQQARTLALAKAQAVAAGLTQAVVLGADTVVSLDEHVIGKARDRNHAKKILSMLSGSSHQVITALALFRVPGQKTLVSHDVTSLEMAQLSEDQIEQYLNTGPWQGKAGAYAIQEDDAFITSVDGSFSNVVGLPMEMLERMLTQFLPPELLRDFRT